MTKRVTKEMLYEAIEDAERVLEDLSTDLETEAWDTDELSKMYDIVQSAKVRIENRTL